MLSGVEAKERHTKIGGFRMADEQKLETMGKEEQKRLDFFAGCAMIGILASMQSPVEGGRTSGLEDASKDAFTGAKAMLKERTKIVPPPPPAHASSSMRGAR